MHRARRAGAAVTRKMKCRASRGTRSARTTFSPRHTARFCLATHACAAPSCSITRTSSIRRCGKRHKDHLLKGELPGLFPVRPAACASASAYPERFAEAASGPSGEPGRRTHRARGLNLMRITAARHVECIVRNLYVTTSTSQSVEQQPRLNMNTNASPAANPLAHLFDNNEAVGGPQAVRRSRSSFSRLAHQADT